MNEHEKSLFVDRALAQIDTKTLSKIRKDLSEVHLRHLLESGLSGETILASKFATEGDPEKIAKMLKRGSWDHGPVLVIPYYGAESGRTIGFKRVRVDPSDVDAVGAKYLSPGAEWIKDGTVKWKTKGKWSLYFPHQTRSVRIERQPHDLVVLTEGEKKAAYLDQIGFCAIGAPGVDMFRDPSSTRGRRILHSDLADIDRGQWLRGKRIVVCFDGDTWGNADVMRAAGELAGMLRDRGVTEVLAGFPPKGGPKGIDDLGFEHGDDAARAVILGVTQTITPIASGNERAGVPEVYVQVGHAHETIAQLIGALATAEDVFVHGDALITVAAATETKPGIREGQPRVVPITSSTVSVFVERTCEIKTPRGEDGWERDNLSARFAKMLVDQASFPGVRRLAGVAATPIVRPDGSLAIESGYDAMTGVFLDIPSRVNVPENPTAAEVEAARAKVERLVTDFPFAGEAHRAVAIAAMLTPLVRHAFEGPAPLTLFEASTPGSGKSKLARAAGLIGLGVEPSPVSFAEDDAEMRKQITALAMEGAGFIWVDNITAPLGGGALCAALTATTWRDRMLGQNRMWSGPLHATWCATGNNVVLGPDVHRRVALCRLEVDAEFPEDRRDFTIKSFDDHVKRERMAYAEALLTIVRGWVHAGRPTPGGVDGWSDFPGWSRWVRCPLAWAGFADPGATRILAREQSDGDRGSLADLLTGFVELAGGTGERHRLSAGALVERAYDDHAEPAAREALEALLDQRHASSSRAVGKLLQRNRDRVFGGLRLRKMGKRDWFVETVETSEGRLGVLGRFSQLPSRDGVSEHRTGSSARMRETGSSDRSGEKRPQTPKRPIEFPGFEDLLGDDDAA